MEPLMNGRLGFAIDNEEAERGLYCISMPVFDFSGEVACTISVSGFKETMLEDIEKIKSELSKCTNEISEKLDS